MKQFSTLLILLFGLLWIAVPAFSQSISYTYDYAGNRTSRVIVLGALKTKGNPADTVRVTPTFAGSDIRIYPNPTVGSINVNISGMEMKNECNLLVYNANGILIINQVALIGINSIDMTTYQPGWYVLRLIIDKNYQEFKIIKK